MKGSVSGSQLADSYSRGRRDQVVSAQSLQYEVREGREAVMPHSGLEVDLAECEFLCSLQEGDDGQEV